MRERVVLPLLFLCLNLVSNAAAQDVPSVPSASVIAAAVAAFPEYDSGPTFDVILKSGQTFPDPIVIPRSFDPAPGGSARGLATYPNSHIVSLVGRSDFVGVGTPLRRWTYPLAGSSFAVSIYAVRLESVVIAGKESLVSGINIYIARAGGPFIYGGHNFRAIDPNFQLFHLNEPYVFFGSQISTGLYKVDSDQVLKQNSGTLEETSLKRPYAQYFSNKSMDSVLKEVFAAWTQTSVPVVGGAK